MKPTVGWLVRRVGFAIFIIFVAIGFFVLFTGAIGGGSDEAFFGFGDAPVYLDNEPAGQIAGQETPAIQSVCESALGYDAAGWVAGTPPTIVCHNETHTGYVPMPEEIQAQENITVARVMA